MKFSVGDEEIVKCLIGPFGSLLTPPISRKANCPAVKSNDVLPSESSFPPRSICLLNLNEVISVPSTLSFSTSVSSSKEIFF